MESSEDVHLSDFPWKKVDTTMVDPITWPTGRLTSSKINPIKSTNIFAIDQLKVHLLSPTTSLPVRSSDLTAGYDLFSSKELVIPTRDKALVSTDISISVPRGTYGRIAPRVD